MSPDQPSEPKYPWKMKPLNEWAIVGMNHYHIEGQRRLFVAMTKGDRCIVEEGLDDQYIWNRLWHKANLCAAKKGEVRNDPQGTHRQSDR